MEADFKLTVQQMHKLRPGKPFQLSHQQLIGKGIDSIHDATLQMHSKHAKAVDRAIRNGKDYRFTADKIAGGKLTMKDVVKNPLVKALANKSLTSATHSLMANGDISNSIG